MSKFCVKPLSDVGNVVSQILSMKTESSSHTSSSFLLINKITALNNKGVSLFEKKQFSDALLFFERTLSIISQLDDSHLCLYSNHSKGSLLEVQSMPITKGLKELLKKSKQPLSPMRNTKVADSTNYDEGMNISVEVLSLDDGVTDILDQAAIVLYNMGKVHYRLNALEKAIRFYSCALEVAEKNLSEKAESFIVFYILHSVGQVYYSTGNHHSVAQMVFLYALEVVQRMFGNTHWMAAIILNCLGVVNYYSSDTNDKSMQFLNEALSIQKIHLNGQNHLKLLATIWNNIGRVHFQRQEFDEAMHAYKTALAIRKQKYGYFHVDVAAIMFNIGQAHHQKEEFDHALEFYTSFLNIIQKILGWNHCDAATAISLIGEVYHQKGDHIQALYFYEQALFIEKLASGGYSKNVAIILNKIGGLYYDKGKMDHALQAYKTGLCVEMKVFQPNDKNIFITMANVAEIYTLKAEYDKALELYKKVFFFQMKNFKHGHHDIPATLNNIGYILYQKGKHYESLQAYQNSLRFSLEKNGSNNLTADAIFDSNYNEQDFDLCSKLSELLNNTENAKDHDYHSIAFTIFNIALIYQQAGDLQQAMDYYKLTLELEKAMPGKKNEHLDDLSMTLYHIGKIHYQWGELDKALGALKESLLYIQEEGGNYRHCHQSRDDHYWMTVARTLSDIGNIYLLKGDLSKMMEAFNCVSRIYREHGMSMNNLTVVNTSLYAFEVDYPKAAAAA